MERLLKGDKGPTTLKIVQESWHLPVIKSKLPSEKLTDFLKFQKGSYRRWFVIVLVFLYFVHFLLIYDPLAVITISQTSASMSRLVLATIQLPSTFAGNFFAEIFQTWSVSQDLVETVEVHVKKPAKNYWNSLFPRPPYQASVSSHRQLKRCLIFS